MIMQDILATGTLSYHPEEKNPYFFVVEPKKQIKPFLFYWLVYRIGDSIIEKDSFIWKFGSEKETNHVLSKINWNEWVTSSEKKSSQQIRVGFLVKLS